MLLAVEARETAQKIIKNHVTEELKKIDDGIKREVENGMFQYSYDGSISAEAKKELMRCGYQIETGSQYNEPWVCIKW